MTTSWLLDEEFALCRISQDLTHSTDWSTTPEINELVASSAIQYERQMKKLIRRYKFDDDRLLANDLSLLLFRSWRMLIKRIDTDTNMILVPVPLSVQRMRERGFNQSMELAKRLSKYSKLSIRPDALARVKSTKPQSGLARDDRIKNVNCAFKGNSAIVRKKHVVLIDDVCTSGATLMSCANELVDAGASGVSAVTIARALLHALPARVDDTSDAWGSETSGIGRKDLDKYHSAWKDEMH